MNDEDPINGNYIFGKQTVILLILNQKNRCNRDAQFYVVLVHCLGSVSFSWYEIDLHSNEPLGPFIKYIIIYDHELLLDFKY